MEHRARQVTAIANSLSPDKFQLLIVVYFGEDGILDCAADAERKR